MNDNQVPNQSVQLQHQKNERRPCRCIGINSSLYNSDIINYFVAIFFDRTVLRLRSLTQKEENTSSVYRLDSNEAICLVHFVLFDHHGH